MCESCSSACESCIAGVFTENLSLEAEFGALTCYSSLFLAIEAPTL